MMKHLLWCLWWLNRTVTRPQAPPPLLWLTGGSATHGLLSAGGVACGAVLQRWRQKKLCPAAFVWTFPPVRDLRDLRELGVELGKQEQTGSTGTHGEDAARDLPALWTRVCLTPTPPSSCPTDPSPLVSPPLTAPLWASPRRSVLGEEWRDEGGRDSRKPPQRIRPVFWVHFVFSGQFVNFFLHHLWGLHLGTRPRPAGSTTRITPRTKTLFGIWTDLKSPGSNEARAAGERAQLTLTDHWSIGLVGRGLIRVRVSSGLDLVWTEGRWKVAGSCGPRPAGWGCSCSRCCCWAAAGPRKVREVWPLSITCDPAVKCQQYQYSTSVYRTQ